MDIREVNIEELTNIIGGAWMIGICFAMLFRFAFRLATHQERYLRDIRTMDFDIEIQEYYWQCIRLGLVEPADEKDMEIMKLSHKDFEQEICNIIEAKGFHNQAAQRWESYHKGMKVVRKKGKDFDEVFNA